MKVVKTLKTVLRRMKNRDRVYVYDEEVECIHRSTFMRVYSAIGFVHLPKRQKYQPATSPTVFTSLYSSSTSGCVSPGCSVLEEDIDVITLGDDIPPRAIIIAWE